MPSSSRLKLYVKTVREVVQQLENDCLGNEKLETCGDAYSHMKLDCMNDMGESEGSCGKILESGRKLFCHKDERKSSMFCRGRHTRHCHGQTYGLLPNVVASTNCLPHYQQQQPQNPIVSGPSPITIGPATQPAHPPTQQPPPPPSLPPPLPPPPAPQPTPESETSSSLFGEPLLIGFFLFGILICIGVSAVVGYMYYTKKQEREKEEERKRLERSKQMDKKKRKTRKKKSKQIIVQKTGEETRMERRKAKDRDREEEEQKWKVFNEANQKENTFLNP